MAIHLFVPSLFSNGNQQLYSYLLVHVHVLNNEIRYNLDFVYLEFMFGFCEVLIFAFAHKLCCEKNLQILIGYMSITFLYKQICN